MNVSITNVDNVNAIIQISISKDDYQEKVNSSLKKFRKQANIPGFRPGTIPVGMVKKMYGKSILAEEINKLIGESLYSYIKDNSLNVLGEPLPNEEKQKPIDFATEEEDYDFYFDVALAPEIKLSLSKDDKIDYYKINIDKELVDRQIDAYKANYGKYEQIEGEATITDLIKGTITELEDGNAKEGGKVIENGVIMASYIKDKEEQDKFIGIKPGDKIVFNPGKAYEGNEVEIASLLQVKKEEVSAIAAEYSFEVTEITRYKEAELNQELFDKVFGEGTVTNETEFEDKVKAAISEQFEPDSDYKFLLDAKELLIKKAGDLQFPEAFLKRWLLTTGEERTTEDLDADFPKIIEDLKFHLIKEQVAKDQDIKIENEDVKAVALQTARAQFAQYGMMGLPEEMVENYANDMLKNEENARNLVDKAMENKLINGLKEVLGLEEKEISVDDFKKLFETEGNNLTEE